MQDKKFRASLSQSQNRKSWCVIFRHPLRSGGDGKPGLRIRRGLGTEDRSNANSLVDQLNVLLSDSLYWKPSAKGDASRIFDPRVVSIFYDDIEARAEDPWATREELIPLPSNQDGYSRIQLVGATGAGKTTLLRQLIGSHPKRDRFPSISTARTTIYDMEIILTHGNYRGVVSFLSRERVRSYIEECIFAAISAVAAGSREDVVVRRLLEHSEQRFRLSYLLGTMTSQQIIEDEDLEDLKVDEDLSEKEKEEQIEISEEDIIKMQEFLSYVIRSTYSIANRITEYLSLTFDIKPGNLKSDERDAFLELLEDQLYEDEETQSLVEEILSAIEIKIDILEGDNLERDRADWPRRWYFETEDRNLFIKTVNRFSSNYAPNFGKLLAPVVQGLRVSGPFRPAWFSENEEVPRFAFIDGEGLGHTPSSASTLPTAVTRRYESADVILLVDNAAQPMQAASLAVLRSAAASGHDGKLAIVFTHFDEVKGDNFPNVTFKRNHILASLENGINAVENIIGANTGKKLTRHFTDTNRVLFVSRIQETLSPNAQSTLLELSKLIVIFKEAITPDKPSGVVPVYDMANLILCVRLATEQFHDHWNARLGLTYQPDVAKEHWTRVKALSRRYAFQWEDQYSSLRPVADLIKHLSERLAAFIANPREIMPANSSNKEQEVAIDRVARTVYTHLHDLVKDRLFNNHLNEWGTAYGLRGVGSTDVRARNIRNIYEVAAPVPGETPTRDANAFLDIIRHLFRDACEKAGAKIIG